MYNQNKKYVVAVVVLLFLITFAGYGYRQRALETARGNSPETLRQLSEEFWVWYDTEVLAVLAANPAAPSDVVTRLAAHPQAGVRAAVTRNPGVSPAILVKLMHDNLVVVRKAAAINPRTPEEGLRAILEIHDGSPEVKLAVVEHPNAPCDVLRSLATDHNDRIQNVATQRVAQCATTVTLPPVVEEPSVVRELNEGSTPPRKQEQTAEKMVPNSMRACAGIDEILAAAYANCVDRMRALLASEKNGLAGLMRTLRKDQRLEALIVAIDRDYREIARQLLDDGLDPNAKASQGDLPLIRAALFGRNAIVEALLDHGAKINQRGAETPDQKRTALIRAVESDQAGTIKLLLVRGADPLVADLHGWTAIHYAAKDGHRQSLLVLVAHGVDVNLRIREGAHAGATPLIAAAYTGQARTLEWLLEHGADPLLSDRYGYTALRLSHERGYRDAVAVLTKGTAR